MANFFLFLVESRFLTQKTRTFTGNAIKKSRDKVVEKSRDKAIDKVEDNIKLKRIEYKYKQDLKKCNVSDNIVACRRSALRRKQNKIKKIKGGK